MQLLCCFHISDICMFSARASSHDITCKPSPAPSLSIFICFGAWGDPGNQVGVTLTIPTLKRAYNSQHSFLPNISSVLKEPSLLGVNPYKVRVVLSKLIHTARVKICRPGVIHGPSTAKPSSCHVHCTLRVIPPTSPCPTFSTDTCKHSVHDVARCAHKLRKAAL